MKSQRNQLDAQVRVDMTDNDSKADRRELLTVDMFARNIHAQTLLRLPSIWWLEGRTMSSPSDPQLMPPQESLLSL